MLAGIHELVENMSQIKDKSFHKWNISVKYISKHDSATKFRAMINEQRSECDMRYLITGIVIEFTWI